MAKKSNSEKDNKQFNTMRNVIIVLVVVIVALSCAIVAVSLSSNKKSDDKEQSSTQSTTDHEHSISTYEMEHEILKGKSIDTAVDNINKVLENVDNGNTYFLIQTSEESYDNYIYNKSGECFAQSSDGAYSMAYLNTGNVVKYDAYNKEVTISGDIDVRSLIHSIVDRAKEKVDGIEVYEMVLAEDEASTEDGTSTGDETGRASEPETNKHEYRIDVIGEKAIREIYKVAGDEFADSMINALKEQLGDSWEPHIIFSYLISNNENLAIACYVIIDNAETLNWVADGYVLLDDWALDKGWYELKEGTDNDEQATAVLETTINTINSLMTAYAEANGLETQDPNTTENSIDINDINSDGVAGFETGTEESADTNTEENSENNTETETETEHESKSIGESEESNIENENSSNNQ